MTLPERAVKLLSQRAQELGIEFPDDQTDLFQNGILDSFALASMISEIEDEVGLKIPDSEVDERNFRTISSIVNYLDRISHNS